MALDSYVCALGRYNWNFDHAVGYEIQAEYDILADQAAAQLTEKFAVSEETAMELYTLSDRTEYTQRIYHTVKALGLID